MKTIRNPIDLQLPMLLQEGSKYSWYSQFVKQLQKEQQIDNKLKIN